MRVPTPLARDHWLLACLGDLVSGRTVRTIREGCRGSQTTPSPDSASLRRRFGRKFPAARHSQPWLKRPETAALLPRYRIRAEPMPCEIPRDRLSAWKRLAIALEARSGIPQ